VSVSDAARTVISYSAHFYEDLTGCSAGRANWALERTPLRGDAQLGR